MGWWFTPDTTKKDMVGQLTNGENVLDHSLVGNNLWVLVQSGEHRVVCLNLLRGERGYGYGYKSMDETMGFYEYNCPLRLINNATEPINDWSKEWREKVHEYHINKRTRYKWKAGDRIQWWNGGTFTLSHKWGRGWITTDLRRVTVQALNNSGKLL